MAGGLVLPDAPAVREVRARGRRDRRRDRDRDVQRRRAAPAAARRLDVRPVRAEAAAARRGDADRRGARAPPRRHGPARVHRGPGACSAPARGSSSSRRSPRPADIAPESRRGEAMSFFTLTLYLGLAIGPPIAEVLLQGGLLPGRVAGRARRCRRRVRADVVRSGVGARASQRRGRRASGRASRLIHPAGIFPGIVILLGLCGMAGFLTFLPLYDAVGRDGRRGPAARRIRPDRRRAADRRCDVARPIRRGPAVRRGIRALGGRAAVIGLSRHRSG